MCGIVSSRICRFSELAPSQIGLTKQLVLLIALPHITLFFLAVGYAIMGCWIMTLINYGDTDGSLQAVHLIIEEKTKFAEKILTEMIKLKESGYGFNPTLLHDNFVAKLKSARENTTLMELLAADLKYIRGQELFLSFANRLYATYLEHSKAVFIPYNKTNIGDVEVKSASANLAWNFFFAVTCLTSIGYGVNAPNSLVGRLFCIVFITLGIPLYLVTIADLAKFCTECMNSFWTECIKFQFQIGQWLKQTLSRHEKNKLLATNCVSNNDEASAEDDNENNVEEVIIAGGEEVAEFLWTHLEKAKFVDVPFLLIYTILIGYIIMASYCIARIEGWPLQEGLYFVMMSVLTIGFGDVMPVNDQFVLITMSIVFVGLIVTTTCVDIVGAYYIDQLHFFGRRLDIEDPLEWLRLVQQKRIEAMKREAMRKLFETVAALQHMYLPSMKKLEKTLSMAASPQDIKLPDLPKPPRGILSFHATAQSMCLRWDPPFIQPSQETEGKRFWYTLSYKTRTPQRKDYYTVVDFITRNHYEATGLKSFTLYEFSVVTTTRFGSSKPVRCQEYTEPCTVPQLIKLQAISSETATLSWKAPLKNNGCENYTLMFTQEPAPQFRYWHRYNVGKRKKFTITELDSDTRYIACVLAQHNFGLAAMSKSLRFKTRSWWYNESKDNDELSNCTTYNSLAVSPSNFRFENAFIGTKTRASLTASLFTPTDRAWKNTTPNNAIGKPQRTLFSRRRSTKELKLFLAPPPWWRSSRRASGNSQNNTSSGESVEMSITSLDYQIS